MSRFFNRKSIAFVLIALALVAGLFGAGALRSSATTTHAAAPKAQTRTAAGSNDPVCQKVGKTIWVSSGAMMYCFGSQSLRRRAVERRHLVLLSTLLALIQGPG